MPDRAARFADRSAFLVMDVQPGIIDRAPDPAAYLARVTEAVRAARGHAVPVIHVVVGFRPGMPEVSTRNQAFGTAKQQRPAYLSDPRPAITPGGSDVVVTKRRVSAFTGSDLEVVLRAGEIDHSYCAASRRAASSSLPCVRPRTKITVARCSPTSARTRTARSTSC